MLFITPRAGRKITNQVIQCYPRDLSMTFQVSSRGQSAIIISFNGTEVKAFEPNLDLVIIALHLGFEGVLKELRLVEGTFDIFLNDMGTNL